jgi:hypothetical protein
MKIEILFLYLNISDHRYTDGIVGVGHLLAGAGLGGGGHLIYY